MSTCLVEYPPKLAVSNLVNSLKGVSSRLLRKERPDIQMWWRTNLHPAPVHRAAADTALRCTEINPKDGSAVRAILPRPERRGLPRTWSRAAQALLPRRAAHTCICARSMTPTSVSARPSPTGSDTGMVLATELDTTPASRSSSTIRTPGMSWT